MESEKVKDIKKVLEEYIRQYSNFKGAELCKNALTLINYLESENERLIAEKQKVLEYMKTDNYAKLKKEDMYWGYQMGIGMLEHEINRQKDRIALLEKENETLRKAKVIYETVDYCAEDLRKAEKRIAELEKGKVAQDLKARDILIDYLLKDYCGDCCGKCVYYNKDADTMPCEKFKEFGNAGCKQGMLEWFSKEK